MSCAACAARVEKVLRNSTGVKEAAVNYAAATARVVMEQRCDPQALADAVADAGYTLMLDADRQKVLDEGARSYRRLRNRTIAACIFTLPLIVIGMGWMHAHWANMVMAVLSTVILVAFGGVFYVGAWRQLRHRTCNMDTLVALSTGIAWLFSMFTMIYPRFWTDRGIAPHVYFEASGVIIAFILLGRTLEARAKGNTSAAIRRLMGLQPATVTRVSSDGSTSIVSIADVKPGDNLLCRPGEKIAVDGTVVEGDSFVNESMLSGEPLPVEKKAGAEVFAGTLNESGALTYRADAVGADTLLSRIIAMVQEAQGSKAPVQRLADKIAAIFVPAIIIIAAIAFILWWILGGESGVVYGILAAITVLIIACPCALGLATPTALMVGIGRAAEAGILVKDAVSLESARTIDTIVLDKTGTLTEGQPSVQSFIVMKGEERELKPLLASLESLSAHPLAKAVADAMADGAAHKVEDFREIAGRGVSGVIDGKTYYVGNRSLMEENDIPVGEDVSAMEKKLADEGMTVVLFADKEGVLALTGITDRIKPTTPEAIAAMKRAGLEVWMLTGDNENTAAIVARRCGIEHWRASMMPEHKAWFINQLKEKGKHVAMAGDGINDSAALAVADLSIAMGTGSDIAMEVASMTIVASDLSKIPAALHLSRLTMRTVRQNLFWAFIYNIIAVPIAAGVLYPVCGFLLNPMVAGAAMTLSSLSVVGNSLLLKAKGKEKRITNETDKTATTMKKTYKVEGMMCNHCRTHLEKDLNALPGVEAEVTLTPPVATVTFTDGAEHPLDELQAAAGDYKLIEE